MWCGMQKLAAVFWRGACTSQRDVHMLGHVLPPLRHHVQDGVEVEVHPLVHGRISGASTFLDQVTPVTQLMHLNTHLYKGKSQGIRAGQNGEAQNRDWHGVHAYVHLNIHWGLRKSPEQRLKQLNHKHR